MTIIDVPTQLVHEPTSVLQDIPTDWGKNDWFELSWEIETSPEGSVFRVLRVFHLTDGERNGETPYAIGIESRGTATYVTQDGFMGTSPTENETLRMNYELQIIALKQAEADVHPNLPPLDSGNEDDDLDTWLDDNFGIP